jgi:hypothetical protein
MSIRALALALTGLLVWPGPVPAGEAYKVTSRDGDKTVTYEVMFGGGKVFEQMTAFDPQTKKFVYLQWERSGKKPDPAMTVWDHRTGETVPLYTFPGAKHPLPAIPSVEAMKVCPLTGDKSFRAVLHKFYD